MKLFTFLAVSLACVPVFGSQGYQTHLAGARVETYKQVGETKLVLNIFEPSGGASTNRPAIVFFFGGGWTNGNPNQFEDQCRYLAARGMVAIAADYRVASRHDVKATTCVADAKSAIRWVRQNAARLRIDPNRIAAGGGSAGGHLAAAAATLPDFDEPSENLQTSAAPNALVLFNPALVLAPLDGVDLKGFERRVGAERMGADPRKLSPAHHVKRGSPPTIIFHGRADTTVPYSTVEAFTAVMKRAGNRCELVGYDEQGHGFFNASRGTKGRYNETVAAMDTFLVSLGYLASAPVAAIGAANSKSTGVRTTAPNVLFLLADDYRPDCLGALGHPDVKTPHLDQLANRGTLFTRAYIMGAQQGAVCVPSRAMQLSGRTLFRVSEQLTNTTTWPMVLREAGYEAFATGKWHNGPLSLATSFPKTRASFIGGMGDQSALALQDVAPGGKLVNPRKGNRHSSEIFADEAIGFLRERDRTKPFALYVAFTAPHDPRTSPPEYRQRYQPAGLTLPKNFLPQHPFDNGDMALRDEQLAPWPRTAENIRVQLADYYAIITHLDAQIGRVLDSLRATGAADNTVIVFAGDNGLALGSHGLMGKQNLYEHSMGIPLMVAGPGIKAGQKTEALCYLHDIFPTLCELTGQPIPSSVEGRSLADVLRGTTTIHRKEIFTAYRNVQRAIRDDRWKLIRYPQVDRTQLFDLKADPSELNDLASQPAQAERVRELTRALEQQMRAHDDPAPLKVQSPKPAAWTPPPVKVPAAR